MMFSITLRSYYPAGLKATPGSITALESFSHAHHSSLAGFKLLFLALLYF